MSKERVSSRLCTNSERVGSHQRPIMGIILFVRIQVPTVGVYTWRRRPWCSQCVCSDTASPPCGSTSVPSASPSCWRPSRTTDRRSSSSLSPLLSSSSLDSVLPPRWEILLPWQPSDSKPCVGHERYVPAQRASKSPNRQHSRDARPWETDSNKNKHYKRYFRDLQLFLKPKTHIITITYHLIYTLAKASKVCWHNFKKLEVWRFYSVSKKLLTCFFTIDYHIASMI